jgi:hypothetical protein
MWKLGLRPRYSFSWEYLFRNFSILSLHCTSQQGNASHAQGRGQQQTWTNQGRANSVRGRYMTAHRAATPLATEAAASGTAAPAPEVGFRPPTGTSTLPTPGANSEAGPGLAGIGQLRLPCRYHWPSEIESVLICIYSFCIAQIFGSLYLLSSIA